MLRYNNNLKVHCLTLLARELRKQPGPSSCYQGEFSFRLHPLGILIDLWNYIQHLKVSWHSYLHLSCIIRAAFLSAWVAVFSSAFETQLSGNQEETPQQQRSGHLNSNGQRQRGWGTGGATSWKFERVFFPLQNFLAINLLNLRIGRYPKLYPNQLYVKSKYIPWWETRSLEPSILIPAPYFFLSHHTLGSPTVMGQDIMGLRAEWVCGEGDSCLVKLQYDHEARRRN